MHAKSFLSFLFLVGSLAGVTRAIAADDPSPPSVTSHELIPNGSGPVFDYQGCSRKY